MPALNSGEPAETRFWRHVSRTEDPDACWLWTAAVVAGYGVFTCDERYERSGKRKSVKAHRFSWALANGRPVPDKMLVCHTCDTPRCVNPRHLFLGDYMANKRDQIDKGRNPSQPGERHWKHKLTEEQVLKIRSMPRAKSARLVGLEYGVCGQTIRDIWKGRTWTHI